MAKGQVLTIPSNTGTLLTGMSREASNSCKILNPNDGILYITINGPAGPLAPQWDWKLPSQSYGHFPGPWQSLGLYYVDQSGGAAAGQFNIYEDNTELISPDIHAIGRALQVAGTNLDITSGTQPQNPPANTGRLWIDSNYNLHVLRSDGTDQLEIDTNDALGGDLTGTLYNPIIAASAVNSSKILDGSIQNVDLAAGVAAANVGALGGSLSGTLPNPTLAPGSVGSSQILDGSIATVDFGAQVVTQSVLAKPSVGQAEIIKPSVGQNEVIAYSLDYDRLTANARLRAVGHYMAAPTWSTTTAGAWVGTPVSSAVTLTSNANKYYLHLLTVPIGCSNLGNQVSVGIGQSGATVSYNLGTWICPIANAWHTFTSYWLSQGPLWANEQVYILMQTAGTVNILTSLYSTLDILEIFAG